MGTVVNCWPVDLVQYPEFKMPPFGKILLLLLRIITLATSLAIFMLYRYGGSPGWDKFVWLTTNSDTSDPPTPRHNGINSDARLRPTTYYYRRPTTTDDLRLPTTYYRQPTTNYQ